jgi:hypothetical protein
MNAMPPTPPQPAPIYLYAPVIPRAGNGMAVASLVCGVVGAVLGLMPIMFVVALILGVLGVIFGGVGLHKADDGADKAGMAIAGVCVGLVAILLAAYGWFVMVDLAHDLGL